MAGSTQKRLGEILLEQGAIDDNALARALAAQTGLDLLGAPMLTADLDLLRTLRRDGGPVLQVLPLGRTPSGTVHLAVADPFDLEAQAQVADLLDAPLNLAIAARDALDAAIEAAGEALADDDAAEELDVLDLLDTSDEDARASDQDDAEDGEDGEEEPEKIVQIAALTTLSGGSLPPLPVTISRAAMRAVPATLPPGLVPAPRSPAPPPLPPTAAPPLVPPPPEPPREVTKKTRLPEVDGESTALSMDRPARPDLPVSATDALPAPLRSAEAFPSSPVGPLVLDGESDRGLAVVARELRDDRSPEGIQRLLAALLVHAIQRRSDAIKLTADGDRLRVEYRIDGVMQVGVRLPAWARERVPAALWRLLGLPPEASLQDALHGLLEARFGDREVLLRVESVHRGPPSSLLLKLRDPAISLSTEALGIPPDVSRSLRQWTASRQGVVLLVGPPDSGRSTTLRALARSEGAGRSTALVGPWDVVGTPGVPVFRFGPDGPTPFAAVTNALSTDPDVLVVDGLEEVAAPVLRAAGQGRLVIAGVTANDAAEALTLLLSSGVPDELLGPQLIGALEQRMLRVLCTSCRRTASLDVALAVRLGLVPETIPGMVAARGAGCRVCRHTGFRGRRPLYTVVEFANGVPAGTGASPDRIRALVAGARARPAAELGLGLVVQSRTSLSEVARALGVPEAGEAERVSVASPEWQAGMGNETVEGPAPTRPPSSPEAEEDTDLSGPQLLPDMLGDAPAGDPGALSDEDTGPLVPWGPEQDAGDDRHVLVVLGAAAGPLRSGLPVGDFRVAEVADIGAARDFIHRELPTAVVVSLDGNLEGTVAKIAALRDDLASAFLPLIALGAAPGQVKTLLRAGVDEAVTADIDGEELELRLRAVIRRLT